MAQACSKWSSGPPSPHSLSWRPWRSLRMSGAAENERDHNWCIASFASATAAPTAERSHASRPTSVAVRGSQHVLQ